MRTWIWDDEAGTIDVLPTCLTGQFEFPDFPDRPFNPDPFNPDPFNPEKFDPAFMPDTDGALDGTFDGFFDEVAPWSLMIGDDPDEDDSFDSNFPDEFTVAPDDPRFEPTFEPAEFFELCQCTRGARSTRGGESKHVADTSRLVDARQA